MPFEENRALWVIQMNQLPKPARETIKNRAISSKCWRQMGWEKFEHDAIRLAGYAAGMTVVGIGGATASARMFFDVIPVLR